MAQNRYQTPSDLPAHIPLFPIGGALLLPRWNLPLNIFEPRYLNMFDDAMTTHGLIGMVQSMGGDRARPDLASIGCVGEIAKMSETEDGRYLVNLRGMIRFGIEAETDDAKPYREAQVNYSPFADDFIVPEAFDTPDHAMIIAALKPYALGQGLETEWDVIGETDMETLVSALSAGCPFDVMEKQALLEAPDLQARTKTLIQLMQINTSQTDGNGGRRLQ